MTLAEMIQLDVLIKFEKERRLFSQEAQERLQARIRSLSDAVRRLTRETHEWRTGQPWPDDSAAEKALQEILMN